MPHIVIDVPASPGTLYLVSPGKKVEGTARLEDEIVIAANSAGLLIPPDDKNTNALAHILPAISASQVIVALCSAGPSLTSVSPEIMYQLGFARSLGKAVLVMVEKGRTLPGLVDDRDLFTFTWDDVGTPALRRRLTAAIDTAKARTKPHQIVDQAYFPQIWASQRHNWLSNPDFFEVFVTASTTSHSATRLLQRMIHAQIDPMLRAVDEIITLSRFSGDNEDVKAHLDQRKDECLATWTRYVSAYDHEYSDTLDTIRRLLADIPSTLSSMETSVSALSARVLVKCQQLARDLDHGLTQYMRHHERAQDFVAHDITAILSDHQATSRLHEPQNLLAHDIDTIVPDPQARSTLSGMLKNLSDSGKKTMIKAVALNYNLLKLAAEASC